MLKVVIIGIGSIARSRHIPSVIESNAAELYGVYNRTPEKAIKISEETGCRVFTSLEEIWKDEQVEAIIICTPPDSHADLAIIAMQNGKHVLVEKPMAETAAEADNMRRAARKYNRVLMVSHNQRLYRPHIQAKQLIEQNEIGKILSYRTFLSHALEQIDGAVAPWKNVIGEVGSHRLDLMVHLLREPIERVFAHLYNVYDENSIRDDNATVIIKHTNNITGTLITSRTSFGASDRSTQFFGTEGVITLYGETGAVVIDKGHNERTVINFPDLLPQHVVEVTDIVERFIQAALGNAEIFVTADEGYDVMRALDAIRLSSKIGSWVDLVEEFVPDPFPQKKCY